MSPERFQRLSELFEQAVSLPEHDRTAFVSEASAEDPEMGRELLSLVEADRASAHGRVSDVIQAAAAELPAVPAGDAGQRLGPWLLVREIGRGGMGIVYQAVRADGEYLQSAAVKLVKRGMDSEAILQRFRAERQILASLSHPNIAGLIDGGTAPDGRPYIVMEYIDGKSLLEYAGSLNTRSKLEIFLQICGAVEAAHRIGVLHRDIKPGNILVTREGIPKLMDFGIARLLTPELVAGDMPRTETHARLLTPEFASPEQIRGEELTSASDVYSLGVVLYELLTSKRPWSQPGADYAELARAAAERTAPKPSTMAASTRLRSELAGDLDNIIGMAIRKEPERRYSTAEEFAADIRSHLAGQPVRAHGDSVAYRVSRWTRRHMWQVTSASVAASAAAASWWWRERDDVPDEVLALCRRAETLVQSDVRAAQPGQGLPAPLQESIRLFQRAAELAPMYLPAWTGLANAAEFSIDYDFQRRQELARLAEDAVQQALRLQPHSAEAFATAGALRFRLWQFREALRAWTRSLAISPRQPYLIADMADCHVLTGKPFEAIKLVEKHLPEAETLGVRAHVVLLGSGASLLRTVGQFNRAREYGRRAVQLQGNYAPARLHLGLVEQHSGDLEAAYGEFQIAFAMRPGDQRCATARGNVAAQMHRAEEANAMLAHLARLQSEGAAVQGSTAVIHAGLGSIAPSVRYLEAAEQARESSLPHRLIDFRLRSVLSSPRGQQIIRRVGVIA